MAPPDRGHHLQEHTADIILEAWGPNLSACGEEAVAALIEAFVAGVDGEVVAERRLHLPEARASHRWLPRSRR